MMAKHPWGFTLSFQGTSDEKRQVDEKMCWSSNEETKMLCFFGGYFFGIQNEVKTAFTTCKYKVCGDFKISPPYFHPSKGQPIPGKVEKTALLWASSWSWSWLKKKGNLTETKIQKVCFLGKGFWTYLVVFWQLCFWSVSQYFLHVFVEEMLFCCNKALGLLFFVDSHYYCLLLASMLVKLATKYGFEWRRGVGVWICLHVKAWVLMLPKSWQNSPVDSLSLIKLRGKSGDMLTT